MLVVYHSIMITGFDPSSSNRPLTSTELLNLQTKHRVLLNEISLEGGLLDYLYQVSCINEEHKESIQNRSRVRRDKVGELLMILRRRSFAQFQLFLSGLESTGQKHVRDILLSPGGLFDLFIFN